MQLFSIEAIRKLEKTVFEQGLVSEQMLMARAGTAAFEFVRQRYPLVRRIAVVCGTGNNAGDGYVLATLAHDSEIEVTIYQLGNIERLSVVASSAREACLQRSIESIDISDGQQLRDVETDLWVDALLGIGLSGELKPLFSHSIQVLNHHDAPIVAIDVPSGLQADRGQVVSDAICAESTITFIGMKQGMVTARARDYVGYCVCDDLALPLSTLGVLPQAETIDYDHLSNQYLSPRKRTAHKGDHGHVLIVGGHVGFSGACRLAGEAALRSGAGLVSIATRTEHAAVITSQCPELMCHGIDRLDQLLPLLERVSVIVLGPGLAQDDWSHLLWRWVLQNTQLPMVMDADALNLLATDHQLRDNWILTPHPGEAARLLQTTSQIIEADRYQAVRNLQQRFGGSVVLKGAGSLVQTAEHTFVCTAGNPGMATAGMGDVLSGVIASLWAQGMPASVAAQLGVALHARAADVVAKRQGERGLMATDVMTTLQTMVNLDLAES